MRSVYDDISNEFGIPKANVEECYRLMFTFIREKIENLKPEDMSYDDFMNEKTNFNIPRLGKMYVNPITTKKFIETINKKEKDGNK